MKHLGFFGAAGLATISWLGCGSSVDAPNYGGSTTGTSGSSSTGGTGGGTSSGGGNGSSSGTCTGTPGKAQKLASTSIHGSGTVAVGTTAVFYLEPNGDQIAPSGSVMRVPKCGGTPLLVAGGQAEPQDLVVVANVPYWVDWGSFMNGDTTTQGSVDSPSGPLVLVSKTSMPWAIAADSTSLYWATDYSGIFTSAFDGSGATQVSGKGSVAIAVDDTTIYFAEDDGSAFTLPKAGGVAKQVSGTTCDNPGGDSATIIVDSTTMYWTDKCGSIWKAPKSGSPVTLLAKQTSPSHTGFGHRIAIDDTSVYWADVDSVMRVDKLGGQPTVVAAEPPTSAPGYYLGGIAVDDTSVYWAAYSGIWRTPKP